MNRRGFAEHGGGQQLRGRTVEIFRHALPGAEIGNGNLPFVQQTDERRERIRLVDFREHETGGARLGVAIEDAPGGGAMLEFFEGKILPGVAALEK